MNWITLAVVGAVAAWFEYSYHKSRRKKAETATLSSDHPLSDAVQVAAPGVVPSIAPGDENDKHLNTAM